MKIVLLGAGRRPGVLDAVERLRPEIAKCCEIVFSDFTGQADVSGIDADLAVVFGGDGSVLRAARQMGRCQLPTLAVGLGTLGFLSNVHVENLLSLLRSPGFADLPMHRYLLLRCRVIDRETSTVLAERLALNEVTLFGDSVGRMVRIELGIDGEAITTYRCDGLILSTPVGSTAHNLAAGGPILSKDLDAVILAPICPHTLSHRPVVESASRRFELRVIDRPGHVVVDGEEIADVGPEKQVLVDRADVVFKMVAVPGHSDYRALQEKLGWSGGLPPLPSSGS